MTFKYVVKDRTGTFRAGFGSFTMAMDFLAKNPTYYMEAK